MERLNRSSIFVALLALAVSFYSFEQGRHTPRFVPLGESETFALDTKTGTACLTIGPNAGAKDVPLCKDLK